MTDKQLLKVVTQFRKGILGKSEPADQCFVVSSPLCGWLLFCGIECKLEEAVLELAEADFHHWYIRLKDGRIIDATASQFNVDNDKQQMPLVYIGECPSYYNVIKSI